LKQNVNLLLTGTVDVHVHVIQMLLTGSLSVLNELCAILQMKQFIILSTYMYVKYFV